MGEATEVSQVLSFKLDEELFALEISRVREVLEFKSVTRVPRTPEFMRGVINLRGNVVPVIDLKLRLGLERTERTVNTCVIIAEVEVNGERTVLGALADSVQEVIDLEPGSIVPPPRIGTRIDASCIRGMGKREEQFVMILDIDRVLSLDELRAVRGEGGSDADMGEQPSGAKPTS